jgi:hypothetical protein
MAVDDSINGLPPEAVSYLLVCRVVREANVGCGHDSATVADTPDMLTSSWIVRLLMCKTAVFHQP